MFQHNEVTKGDSTEEGTINSVIFLSSKKCFLTLLKIILQVYIQRSCLLKAINKQKKMYLIFTNHPVQTNSNSAYNIHYLCKTFYDFPTSNNPLPCSVSVPHQNCTLNFFFYLTHTSNEVVW